MMIRVLVFALRTAMLAAITWHQWVPERRATGAAARIGRRPSGR